MACGLRSGPNSIESKGFCPENGFGLDRNSEIAGIMVEATLAGSEVGFFGRGSRTGRRAARNALRRFKRKVQQEDIIKEVKRHSYYLKPGEKRRVKAALARKRNRKKARKEQD